MNSSLQKALLASLLAVGGSMTAIAQGWDWDGHCIDPNNTAPYSNPFGTFYLETPLWSAGLGIVGTCAYGTQCFDPAVSVNVAGRFQFGPGPQGSIQDNLRVAQGEYDVSPDDYEDFQVGSNHGHDPFVRFGAGGSTSGNGWSFAQIRTVSGTTQTNFAFGSAAFYEYYQGASNRYVLEDELTSNVDVRLVVDVLGDTSRFSWRLTNMNTTTAIYEGLWLGQWIEPIGGFLADSANPGSTPVDNYGSYLGDQNVSGVINPYVFVPGQKPRVVEQSFIKANDPVNFPAYCDIAGGIIGVTSPAVGGGIQVVNSPTVNVEDQNGNSDQTPVDEFDLGDVDNLLSGIGSATNPTFNNNLLPDVNFGTGFAFAQKWNPTVLVPAGGYRDIISYYRSIWGDSSYSNGYTAVVDTPKVIAYSNSATDTLENLNPNPFTIRVNVDNTGGFGQVYQQINMNNVAVTLTLPQGMHDPNNPALRTITQIIPSIPATTMASTDFTVAVDNTVTGSLPYTVTIVPSPGATKTVTGSINVAATPILQLLQGANLVTSPWVYSQSTWESILAPLAPITDYQTYTWDASQQAYVIQTGPQRGIGTWVVANTNDGYVPLQGSPSQPSDELPPALGAPNIQLQPGWNLVGNPYNYSFPLGQLVGVAAGTTQALTFSQLVSANYFDGSFAYYDPANQNYNFLQNTTDELLPNYGYWVYANSAITLSFPPVYDLFVRAPKVRQNTNQVFNHYKLQLSAVGSVGKDVNTFVGLDATAAPNYKNSRKSPISPSRTAIRAIATSQNFIPGQLLGTGQNGHNIIPGLSQGSVTPNSAAQEFGQLVHSTLGKQVYNYSVYSAGGGPVTVSWPNLSSLPRNLQVTLKDLSTGSTTVAKSGSAITYYAAANSMKTYQVTITPLGTVRQTVSNVTTQVKNTGGTKQMKISFNTTTTGQATLTIFQNGKQVGTVIQDMGIVAGTNSVVWPMTLSNGQVVTPGSYTLEISALGEGGDTGTKLVNLSL